MHEPDYEHNLLRVLRNQKPERATLFELSIARSRNGIDGWERSPFNPIIAPSEDETAWDGEACYKPFVLYDEAHKRWMLWYNGRVGELEQIGMATLDSETILFE